jgi:hypothetical protein
MSNVLTSASPIACDLYGKLLAAIAPIGSYREEFKKTCIHVVRSSAFLGIHLRKEHLLVTIKSGKPLRSRRIVKSEKASAMRWYLDVKIATPSEIDKEFLRWVRQSFELSGDRAKASAKAGSGT